MIAFWLKGSDKGKKTTRAGVKGKKTRAPSALSLSHELKEIMLGWPVPYTWSPYRSCI